MKDKGLPFLRSITKKWRSKTSPVTYRPSRSMHWWTRFVTLPITRTWQVIWHFFVQTHRFILCQSAELSDTRAVLFKLPCTKTTQADRSGEWAGRIMSLLEKVWKANVLWTADLIRYMMLQNGVYSWAYSELSFVLYAGLLEYYVNHIANLVSCCMRGCSSTT